MNHNLQEKGEKKIPKPFKNLDQEKQQRILDAALKEFAEQGYEQASTNRMVKDAGIGKGMLFYYFKNKKELFHYLVDYSLDITIHHYLEQIDTEEKDFIERLKQTSAIKMKTFLENPNVFNFMGTILLSKPDELPKNYHEKFEELQRIGFEKIYGDIDKSLFREDIDVDKAFQLIQWSMDGYQNEKKTQLQGQKMSEIDFEYYIEEFNEYLDLMKRTFYK
ncbi:TetR/AcrR family transcriptional regulator [Halalkalibacillus sediminis]|uniref:TetR/AcrR family transcriptional regulator n=1 Tax=Halalkalibacillus sediminis TaxID=2018042 RepID=A0A2I0QTK2_9BACI|nr:TetR/AcrR family transcriptional regulator [Halalkalibacillus sediminis]PKR77639.1 TetR/AcrR family transcriptional regulator [Halalkalibacillus sediminis]